MINDSHLLLNTLEQMKELLSSPGIDSRAHDPLVTNTLVEFYELINEYSIEQDSGVNSPEDPEKRKAILVQLASKIDIIDQHVNLNLKKLSFLSKVAPKS
jgi:hypothetical protein